MNNTVYYPYSQPPLGQSPPPYSHGKVVFHLGFNFYLQDCCDFLELLFLKFLCLCLHHLRRPCQISSWIICNINIPECPHYSDIPEIIFISSKIGGGL